MHIEVETLDVKASNIFGRLVVTVEDPSTNFVSFTLNRTQWDALVAKVTAIGLFHEGWTR
jgi:hypothetical protein